MHPCVVQQLLGARVSILRMSLHLIQWPVTLSSPTEDQGGLLKLNKLMFLCLLGGFTCLKAVPRCFQLFCCVFSSKKPWLDQAHWILILSAAFCSRSHILTFQEKAFSSRPAATNAFICPFYSFYPLFYFLLSSAAFILTSPTQVCSNKRKKAVGSLFLQCSALQGSLDMSKLISVCVGRQLVI